jgi:DNA-binding NarL/FixJ family response regulator
MAIALRTLATVDAAADARTVLDRARSLARASGDLRLAAQVDTDLAGLLLLLPSSGTTQAVDLLRAAEEYAAVEALWPLHARVTRLLERAGGRPRPLRGDAAELLTHAEQRVARLAARGLTNRQIAEQLAVTVKGVEWHLSRVYRKLGIRSRTDLAELVDVGRDFSATA